MTLTLVVRKRLHGEWVEHRREDITARAKVTPKRIQFRGMTFKRPTGEQIGWDWRSMFLFSVIEEQPQPAEVTA